MHGKKNVPDQIAEFTRRLLSSKPSLAAFGDGTEVLNYDTLVQRFQQGNWAQRSSNPMGLGPAPGSEGQMVHGVFERLKQGLMSGSRGISSSSSSNSSSSCSTNSLESSCSSQECSSSCQDDSS